MRVVPLLLFLGCVGLGCSQTFPQQQLHPLPFYPPAHPLIPPLATLGMGQSSSPSSSGTRPSAAGMTRARHGPMEHLGLAGPLTPKGTKAAKGSGVATNAVQPHSKPSDAATATATNTRRPPPPAKDQVHDHEEEGFDIIEKVKSFTPEKLFGQLDNQVEGASPQDALLKAIEERNNEDDDQKPPAEVARNAVRNLIQKSNVINYAYPYAEHFVIGPLMEKIKESKKPKPPEPAKAVEGEDKPAESIVDKIKNVARKVTSVEKTYSLGDLNFRFDPQNFRSVYWLYPILGAYIASRYPGPHTIGFLPWTFYFANLASHVISWDPMMWAKTIDPQNT